MGLEAIQRFVCWTMALVISLTAASAVLMRPVNPDLASPVLHDDPSSYAFLEWQDEASWGPWGLEISDVDGNGIREILVGSSGQTDWDFRIYEGSDHSRLLNTRVSVPARWHFTVEAGNMDDDAYEEIVVPSWVPAGYADTVLVLRWNGSALQRVWGSGFLIGETIVARLSDVDGDGRQEAFALSTGSSSSYKVDHLFVIEFNSTSGGFDVSTAFTLPGDIMTGIAFYDMDDDHVQEIFVRSMTGIYAIDGSTWTLDWSVTNTELAGAGGDNGFDVGDPDGDGSVEVVASGAFEGVWRIAWIDVASKSVERQTPEGLNWISKRMRIWDVDQDSVEEIVAPIILDPANTSGGYLVILDGRTGALEFRSRDFGDSQWVAYCLCSTQVGNVDLDPEVEVLIANYQTIYQYQVNISAPAIGVDVGDDQTVYEGATTSLTATVTGARLEDVAVTWDLNAVADSDGDGDPTDDVDALGVRINVTYGDDGVYVVTATARTTTGGKASDRVTVTVLNVRPSRLEVRAFSVANLTLRVAGEKWHDVSLTIYRDGAAVANASVIRTPGGPDDQAVTIGDFTLDLLEGNLSAVVVYTPDDDPINGQPNGANPAWLIFTARDGSESRIHHTFNVNHNDTWIWRVDDLRALLAGMNITFAATAIDPGSDDLTFTWEWGDGTPATPGIHFNNGANPDPYPSPGGTFPFTATEVQTHSFAMAGTYVVKLMVVDDDGGIADTAIFVVIP